jgi:hypothetical protein
MLRSHQQQGQGAGLFFITTISMQPEMLRDVHRFSALLFTPSTPHDRDTWTISLRRARP